MKLENVDKEDFELVVRPINKIESRRKGVRQQPYVYELFIKKPNVIKTLSQLEKGDFGSRGQTDKVPYIRISKNSLYDAKGRTRIADVKKMGGAAHGFNKIFVAAEIPFFALTEGDDFVRIGRISDSFDPTKYRTKWAKTNLNPIDGKPWYRGHETYHEPPDYVRERMIEWKEKLVEIGIDFNKVYDIDHIERLIEMMPSEMKEIANRDWEKYKEGEMEEISTEEIEEIEAKEKYVHTKGDLNIKELNSDLYLIAFIGKNSKTHKVDAYVYTVFDPKKHYGIVLRARGYNIEIAKNISQELQSKLGGTFKYICVKEDIYKDDDGALCEDIYMRFNFDYMTNIKIVKNVSGDICDKEKNAESTVEHVRKNEQRESWPGKFR